VIRSIDPGFDPPDSDRNDCATVALVAGLKRRDPEAEEAFYHRYHRYCFCVAMRVLKNEEDAADQAQTAMLRVLLHIRDYREQARFSSWLARIVVNECLMGLRTTRRWCFVDSDEGVDCIPDTRAATPCPERQFTNKQTGQLLRREVDRLPKPFRQVLTLRYFEERPMENVASLSGLSVSAAKSMLHRARLELRLRLERHGTL
jgi:RNA polymerase sigma-70 factor, ECF subfamily